MKLFALDGLILDDYRGLHLKSQPRELEIQIKMENVFGLN